MKSFRGISPLVAVVMLIAFTLLVAGILGGLVTQFAQEQRAVMQYCTGARVLVLSAVYTENTTTGMDNVIFSIQNFGDVDLTFNLLQTHLNGTVSKLPETIKVDANDVGQLAITGVDVDDTAEFTIQSQECSGAQDLIKSIDLKAI